MFILPVLLYLQVRPLFGQCLYHYTVPNKSCPQHADGEALSPQVFSRPCTLLGWVGPVWVFLHHTSGRVFAPTYDLACNRPIHGAFSVESSFEPETFRPKS
ncbi:hypothetical protein AVEN_83436-1 [Araneus ventricosus]|uniref:Secreted protein n=1 Tax=Araneus ventricosus TaxID=182803 RepID=A0A4Y2BSH5_ARAVE|nr:hypothetical protein AVEN_83436-1 [Araneus ventricosus]